MSIHPCEWVLLCLQDLEMGVVQLIYTLEYSNLITSFKEGQR